jgi:Rps23 Pro-64 3,4-dihydroxylase Tpa1-like proline 4-hydroxylase|tara:strand:+ start:119 stop:667 length:549 start_codon:yes stop_codon:yes gene_type:complete
MDHTEFVVEIKNIINPEFIKKIIPVINHKAKKHLDVINGFRKDVRNVKGYHIDPEGSPTDIFYWNYIKSEIERLYTYYKIKFPIMKSDKINQIDLLKYSVGGKYNAHTDHGTYSARHLSIIMNLNDDYEGGELVFTDQKFNEIKKYKLGKGSIIFFPSNFMYPHSIQPITKGKRYSIVSWLQ